jgi:hypothetical protein
MTVIERISKYLERCPPAVSGSFGHKQTFRVALALVRGFTLSQEAALPFLRQYNQRCQPAWSEHELKYKLASASGFEPRNGDFPAPGYLLAGDKIPLSAETSPVLEAAPQAKPAYDPAYLERFTEELADEIDQEYLELRSEFTCDNRSPAGFLHKVFRPGEHVWVTDNTFSSDGLIWAHDGSLQNLAELNHLVDGHQGVWYLSNPIDGAPHQLERLVSARNRQGISFRAAECVTDWRYIVLETDDAPEDLWLKALCLLRLPLVAIYHSGGRGAHALVNLGVSTLQGWREQLDPHRDHLIRLGACPGTLTPVRLSRLPNCLRGQTGRLQQLLYLAPNADFTPIAERPAREPPLAVWKRYLAAAHYGPSDND